MANTKKQNRTIAAALTGLVAIASLVAAFTGHLTTVATNVKQVVKPSAERPQATPSTPTAAPNGSPATATPAVSEPAITSPKPEPAFEFPVSINAFGGWEHRGDTDMDTNSMDPVKATTKTKVLWNSERVDIAITFGCSEYGGDGTAYSGTRTFPLYFAPPGKKIVTVNAQGPFERDFEGSTRGKQHDLIDYTTSGTYWDSLRYRIDTKDSDDSPHVGVGGKLTLSIQLAPM